MGKWAEYKGRRQAFKEVVSSGGGWEKGNRRFDKSWMNKNNKRGKDKNKRRGKGKSSEAGTDLVVVGSSEVVGEDRWSDKNVSARWFARWCGRFNSYSFSRGAWLQCTIFVGASCGGVGNNEFEVVYGAIARGVIYCALLGNEENYRRGLWAYVLDVVVRGVSGSELVSRGELYFLLANELSSGSVVLVRVSEYRVFLDHLGVEGTRKLFMEEFKNLVVFVVDDLSKIGQAFFVFMVQRCLEPMVYRRSFGRLHY